VATPESTESKVQRPTYTAEAIPSDVTNSQFLGNPVLDNVVSCLVAMGAEMWATKRRMKVLESVLAKSGISADKIEKYVPTAAETAAWDKDRDRYIELILGPLSYQGSQTFSKPFDPSQFEK
jgi:hypothetical protein